MYAVRQPAEARERPKWGINRVVKKKQLLKFIPKALHCLVHFIVTLAQLN